MRGSWPLCERTVGMHVAGILGIDELTESLWVKIKEQINMGDIILSAKGHLIRKNSKSTHSFYR